MAGPSEMADALTQRFLSAVLMVTFFGISLRGLQLPKVCGRGVVQTATRPNVIRKVLEWPRRMSGRPLIESALD